MKLQYDDGPAYISMGAAGEFRRGEAREVPDELAAGLLQKQTISFYQITEPVTPANSKEE